MKEHSKILLAVLVFIILVLYLSYGLKKELEQIDNNGGFEAVIDRVWKGKQD